MRLRVEALPARPKRVCSSRVGLCSVVLVRMQVSSRSVMFYRFKWLLLLLALASAISCSFPSGDDRIGKSLRSEGGTLWRPAILYSGLIMFPAKNVDPLVFDNLFESVGLVHPNVIRRDSREEALQAIAGAVESDIALVELRGSAFPYLFIQESFEPGGYGGISYSVFEDRGELLRGWTTTMSD